MHDLLLTLAVAWMCFPWAFFFAGCKCCGPITVPCTNCLNNVCAQQYEVIVSGMANGSCGTCANLDATYVVSPAQVLAVCRGTQANSQCTSYFQFTFAMNATNILAQFTDSFGSTLNNWRKTYSSPIDETTNGDGGCLFKSLSVPFLSNVSAECSATAATCTVSYL